MLSGKTDETVPVQCSTPEERAAREAATQELLQRRERTSDDAERQALIDQVVELNIEIARGIARRFRARGAEADDLEQVAYLGLVNAAHHYRLDADTPFIGFAIPSIRGEVKRYFRDCAWTVRIPRRLQEVQASIMARLPDLQQQLNRDPTRAELADYLDLEVDEVEEAMAANGCFNVLSLDRPSDVNANLTLADLVIAEDDGTVDQLEAVDMLRPVLEELGARERRILELRFVEGWTQTEIGREVGLSQMQVSRVLRKILDDLRTKLTTPTKAVA